MLFQERGKQEREGGEERHFGSFARKRAFNGTENYFRVYMVFSHKEEFWDVLGMFFVKNTEGSTKMESQWVLRGLFFYHPKTWDMMGILLSAIIFWARTK